MKAFIVSFMIGAIISYEITYIWLMAFSRSKRDHSGSISPVQLIDFTQNDKITEKMNENRRFNANSSESLSKYNAVNELKRSVNEANDARELVDKVRVLCWIMTSPKSHWKAIVVRDTWGRRCNILLFISSQEDPIVPTVKVNLTVDSRNTLWGKTKRAFEYVHQYFRDQADWFMKADDDTYVVVENLRYKLQYHQPSDPIWFGCRFKGWNDLLPQGYHSGGSGYVLSREALDRFVEFGLQKKPIQPGKEVGPCKVDNDGGAEDVEIGRCLRHLGVIAGDSRDELQRYTFFPFGPGTHVSTKGNRSAPLWYWKYIYYPTQHGLPNCCSSKAIAFHYIKPDMMTWMEYVLYHLRPLTNNYKILK